MKFTLRLLVTAGLLAGPGFTTEPEPSLPLERLGRLRARTSSEIGASSWSIGGETLDRDFASYEGYRAYLGLLGAKAIRLQAGWAKCEPEPGRFSWEWLDAIVDDALARGVQPWLQLSYGNPAYPGGGESGLGSGGPVSPEALAGWERWVTAAVRRYRDRVREWEVWNEPDLRSSKMPLEGYVDIFVRTADIIRVEQPGARIYALSLANNVEFAGGFLHALEERDRLGLVDAITFHGYPHNPDNLAVLEGLRAVVARYPRAIELRQGETGAPSGPTTKALRNHEWSEVKQAKWNLRRMMAHHARGVPVNLFTLSDLSYPEGINSKGLLATNPDRSVNRPKPAFFAAQHVFSVFDADVVVAAGVGIDLSASPGPVAAHVFERTGTRRHLVALWLSGEPPLDVCPVRRVDLVATGARFEDPVLVDLRTGEVFSLEDSAGARTVNGWSFTGVPLQDSPVLLASRADLPLE